MRFNPIARELVCKIVYYGPGLAGKTSNMQWVRDHAPAGHASELVSVDTHSERTLHFDWLALDLGQVHGVNVRFELFTVPGQNYYAATRRQVLQGADGVVFVADSRREALDENIDSMNEMLNNLRHHGLPDDLPVVMQYNKQDLSTALRREQLEPLMNVRGWPSFAATAIAGEGVNETARAIGQMVAERASRHEPPEMQTAPAPQGGASSWLISCYRCQTILEVPNAGIGAVYTCGVCGSTLEVTDSERGLTRAPSAREDDSGGYAMQGSMLPENPVSALSGSRTQPIERPAAVAEAGAFELEGYDVIATLDESAQGRRTRVRERASGRALRAYALAPQLMRQPGYRENLEPYVRMSGPIKHPNVLPLANLRPTHDSAVLLSADPPDHEPLAHVLARRRALAPPHAMGLLRQLSLALEEAARHGVVHGWLRPDVILVSPDGSVLLDELCVPKNHRFLVRELSGASAATEYYLAPEHLGDETRSDLRSDIFALGSLLFRMITGEGLVTGYSAHEALHKIVANGARPLRSTQAGVSRDLDLFYQRLVATERKDRFQTYREVIEALDRFGGGAKRQTLKLTGTVASTGTARTSRSSAGAHIARRAAGGGSGSYAGRPRQPGAPQTGQIRKKEDNTVVIAVVAVVVLAMVAVIFVMATQGSSNRPVEQPPVVTRPTPTQPPRPIPATRPDPPRPAAGTTAGATGSDAAMTAVQRMELLRQVADLRTEERFQAAHAAAGRLDDATQREALQKEIVAQRDQRKKDLEAAVGGLDDVELIRQLLKQPQASWGMPGDADWAAELLKTAQTRIAAVPATTPPERPRPVAVSPITGRPLAIQPQPEQGPVVGPQPQPDGAPPATGPAPAFAPVTDPAAQANVTIDQALLAYAPAAAQQAIANLDPAALETRALRHKIEWWGRRTALVSKAAGKAKMRIPNPTTSEDLDVVGANADHIDVSSPSGSRSTLPWAQFAPKDLARVVQSAAELPEATPEDSAITVVMWLLANDTTQASLHLKTRKAAIDGDLAAELEALLSLHRRRELVEVLGRANEAVRTGNARGISEALAELRRADRTTQAALSAQITRLDEAHKALVGSRPVAGPTAQAPTTTGKDKLTFESLEDMQSLPEQEGRWQVNGGAVTNTVEEASLSRRDVGTAKSVSLRFQVPANKGTVTVQFRGAKVVLDLAASTYTASGKTAGRPKGFAFIPKLPYTLLIERKDDSRTMLQFNNGAESTEVQVGDLSDTLSIAVEGGVVSLDEIELFREGRAQGVADKQKALKVTGWEPINGAYLEAPSIVLPASPGSASGIATPLRDNVSGYNFEVRGSGKLQVKLTRGDGKEQKFVVLEADLPKNPQEWTTLAVRWTEKGIGLYDGKGAELQASELKDRYTHLVIVAPNQATLASTPRIEYRAP